ncbi:lactate dehydrogenase [Ktedonobacteria bacterium brp13]|nr:lactate dehydrogenase [Ktedonobacteria bacterium brp13]
MLKENVLHSLKALLPGGQVFVDRATLISYEVDAGLDKGLPEAVVFPRTTEEVMRVVRWANEHGIPLIARGAGTGLSGGAVAERGGIIVEFVHMNAISDFEPRGRSAVVQPALINLRLDERARLADLYFPPDPSSQRASTMGGNVAENSGGPHCFKYGVTTNYIVGLEIVLADGRRMQLNGRAQDYPEYDLCGLVTGSEGTLALITAITTRLLRNPPGVKTLLAIFRTVEEAGVAVSAVIAAGLVPATMEMMDTRIVQIVEPFAHAGLPLDAGAVLIIEFDGYPESLAGQLAEVQEILLAHGGYNLRIAQDEDERTRIWLARKSAAGAIAREVPAQYTVDITVPRSRLAAVLKEVNAICDRYALRVGHVFHAGDGNLHPLIMIPDPDDPDLIARVHAAGHDMVECCVAQGGSLTGEHGVGIEKRQHMLMMHNAAELLAMWDIKQVFDPANRLNPGKVFPAPQREEDFGKPYAGYQPIETLITTLPAVTEDGYTPRNAQEAAQQLRALSLQHQPVTITGGVPVTSVSSVPHVSSMTLAPAATDTLHLLSTSRLQGIITYAPDDLYVTVGAGTPLAAIQAFLAEQNKQLPLVSPWSATTIGGLVAANINAPLRMRYGAIRDNVLCATVALADGRVIRTGRPIVKNVAGYDMTKIFIGSYGTLGLFCDLSLKVLPMPRARRTLVWPISDLASGLRCGQMLLPLALNASAILLTHSYTSEHVPASPYHLFYTAEGIPEDVHAELRQVRELLRLSGALNTVEPLETDSITGTQVWSELVGASAAGDAAQGSALVVRIGVPVKNLAAYCEAQAEVLGQVTYSVDFANGFVHAVTYVNASIEAQMWLQRLREPALAQHGYAIVVAQPEALRNQLDLWGYQPSSLSLMHRLQQRWDPQHIMNPDYTLFKEGHSTYM